VEFMAVTATPISSDLIIYVAKDGGIGSISRKYADVKYAATDDDVFDVANGTNGLAKLQSRAVQSVQRVRNTELENA